MAVESAADRATFLSTDEFGVEVTWSRGGTPSTLNAIFGRPSLLVDQSADGGGFHDRQATLICREADLPSGAAEGDPVSVAGQSTTFTCRTIRPDGQGMAVVDLNRA